MDFLFSELSTIILIAITCIIIVFEILHFFGLLELEKIHKKLSNIILVLLSLFIILMITNNYSLNSKLEKMNESMENIEKYQNTSVQNLIAKLEEQIPGDLSVICKEQFSAARKLYTEAIIEEKMIGYIEEEEDRYFWRIMEKNPHEYFGVGLAEATPMWYRPDNEKTILEEKTEEYIKNGGKVIRVLYLKDDIPRAESNKIIKKQLEMNVIVYTIRFDEIPQKYRSKFFAVVGDFVDVAIRGNNDSFEYMIATNPTIVGEYREYKDWLLENGKLRNLDEFN